MRQSQRISKQNLDILEIKLDRAIQNFLERRNYEIFDVEKIVIENNSDLEFIKISHIFYDRSKEDSDLHLIDFQQILSAISSYSGKFIYKIEGTLEGIDLYIGSTDGKFLKDTFEGIYSGSKTNIVKTVEPNNYKHTKAMLGIPSLKRDSDKSFKQYLEKILFPMLGKEFSITLVAESYRLETIQEIISNYQSLGDELHKFVKITKNIQESQANTKGTSESLAKTKGSSKSLAKTKGSSESTAKTQNSTIKALKGVLLPMIGLGSVGTLAGSNSEIGSKLAAILHEVFPSIGSSYSRIEAVGTGEFGDLWEDIKAEWSNIFDDYDQIGEMAEAGADTILGPLLGGAIGLSSGAMLGMLFGPTLSSSTTETKTRTNSTTETKTRTNSTTQTHSANESDTFTQLQGITFEEINKSAKYCEELIDKYIERFQKGLNHGMWNCALYIQANDGVILNQLEHTLKSVYSGDETFYESIRFTYDLKDKFNIEKKFPMLYLDDKFLKHPIHPSFSGFTTAINTEELSLLATLPNNDVDGISVSKTSSFGSTQSKNIDKYKSIDIGNVLIKKKSTKQRFKISFESLNSHLFVSGITGSGKSNTIKTILTKLQSDKLDKKIPFLVIEPAKSEYKHLLANISNLQIFRPGTKDDIFKFNPFIFEHSRKNKSVTLTKHVDMLKTVFSSAFPMYGPMPYILEEAIYKIYEDRGWDFETEDNPYFTDSKEADYDRQSLLFPNMEDLKNKIESVVEESGYAGELDSNLKAALKTRIKNLTIGAKGKIFNSRHAFSSDILFEKPTIIELSSIVDDEEKAFLMGLIFNKLYQYREEKGLFNNLQHVTVIEEAHRLLPNVKDRGLEEANSKAKAVETFTNILAEIRAYGEGIIIADQIASKLHPDVVKNTNIKIIQRTMDKEDRELVGNSINLNEDQILDIAELKPGEAIVHNKDIHQAFMVKIDEYNFKNIEDSQIDKFYQNFLERNDKYKYEIIYEKDFYVPNSELTKLKDINNYRLQKLILDIINSVFFDEKNTTTKWDKFKTDIKVENENIYFYLAIRAFNQFKSISNIKHYNDIDSYLQVYRSFLVLIKSLIENKNIDKSIQKFKKSFKHKNIKQYFPSMKYYDNENIDYTLLILENISLDMGFKNSINFVMNEKLPLKSKLDKILIKKFKTTSFEAKYSLAAIRVGMEEINFTKILK